MQSIKEELQGIKGEIVAIEQNLGSLDMWREKIKKEFRIDEIKARLLAIPREIENKQIEAINGRIKADNAEQSMKEREAELIFEISMEMNGTTEKPKPKFSNETARKAELTRRLKEDNDYVTLRGMLESARSDQVVLEFAVDRLRKDYQTQIAFKDLAVAEMNLLGA